MKFKQAKKLTKELERVTGARVEPGRCFQNPGIKLQLRLPTSSL